MILLSFCTYRPGGAALADIHIWSGHCSACVYCHDVHNIIMQVSVTLCVIIG